MIETICVIGAGTMGSGIAQVAAQSGCYTLLFDINSEVLEKAKIAIQKNLQYLVDKQKITAAEKEMIYSRIRFVNDTNDCVADVVIEAIVEKIAAKVGIFNQLAEVNHSKVIFATNTSSLSVSDIQAEIIHPERVVGMHFFNPAPLMKLVEVVKGNQTSDEAAQTIYDLCKQMNKVPVLCKDAPGFIVNRVARHYYLEAMKLVERGEASFENVDAIMEATGFKMGPFKLMDLIGMDINLAVSQSIYEAFDKAERFTPSPIQMDKVAKGDLGKKTGKGFYQY
ncbi:3-hydroxyacyl-CoA dehydrogenase NAD-binding domain-containing protein [Ferruginibacter sp. SUN106]|uniref:3-hydroxyacyl-CoA dehydrogenase NAD-binding domain-containing protein n=1 Tax=Ferruginibacter sp. SUN106 TaxID=2978348 RepID=UPI003D36A11C